MNLQNTKDISFNDCSTLDDIKRKVIESKTLTSKVSFGKLPQWYLYCFSSRAQYEKYLNTRMILMSINR